MSLYHCTLVYENKLKKFQRTELATNDVDIGIYRSRNKSDY